MVNKQLKKYLFYFLILVYVSGAIGFILNPDFFSPFTPFTLLLTCIVFLIHQPVTNTNYILTFCLIVLIGFIVEVAGVKTGLVFGEYYYGDALGYSFLGVPLIISVNWGLLINAGNIISNNFSDNVIIKSVWAAVIITSVDFLMEQVVASLNFWHFKNNLAGIHNYIGWFTVSFLISLLFQKNLTFGNKKIAISIISLQVYFFGLIYLMKVFNFVLL